MWTVSDVKQDLSLPYGESFRGGSMVLTGVRSDTTDSVEVDMHTASSSMDLTEEFKRMEAESSRAGEDEEGARAADVKDLGLLSEDEEDAETIMADHAQAMEDGLLPPMEEQTDEQLAAQGEHFEY